MENTRLLELAGLLTEKKWSGDVNTKWKPEEGFFTKSASEIVKGLLAAPGGHAKAMFRLNFYINRAGKNLSDSEKSKLEVAKKKLEALKEEADAVARCAGLIVEKKSVDAEDADMDMGDDEPTPETEAPKGKKKDEEETLPKIVKKIAKKAVGKDEEELEELIMKVYDAGHKDGEKEAEEEMDGGKSKKKNKDEPNDDESAKPVKESADNWMDKEVKVTSGAHKGKSGYVNKVHKEDGKVVGLEVQDDDDNFFEVKPSEVSKIDESVVTEKHHVKKGKKVVKKGSKAECDDYAEKNGGEVVKGEPVTEEVDEVADEDLVDFETAVVEDAEQIAHAFAKSRAVVGKPCMTPKGKGVITGIVKQPKAGADGKAGPFVHSVTVKVGDLSTVTTTGKDVKLFKGKDPKGVKVPKSVSSTEINNADKHVTAKGGKEPPGKMPKTTGSFLEDLKKLAGI